MKRKKTSRAKHSNSSPQQAALLRLMAVRAWHKEVEGYLSFILRLNAVKTSDGKGWREGNKKYYMGKLLRALDSAPSGTEQIVSEIRNSLETIS